MSDDFDFDPNDLFDDFDDDDDDFGDAFDDDSSDDVGGFDDFDDFDDDVDVFDDQGFDFMDEDDEFDAEADEFDSAPATADSGNFRTLVIAMIALFVVGLVIIVGAIIFNNMGNARLEETRVAILNENMTRQAQIEASGTVAVLNETATHEAQLAGSQTAVANQQATQQAGIAQSATAAVVSLTETQAAIEQSTADAAASATQVVLDAQADAEEGATQTAIAVEMTLNPDVDSFEGNPYLTLNGLPVLTANGAPVVIIDGQPFAIIDNTPVAIAPGTPLQTSNGTPVEIVNGVPMASGDQPMPTVDGSVSLSAVQQTATALAELFNATPTQADIVPTSSLGQGGGLATSVPGSTPDPGSGGGALPDTGLFDDVFGGNPMLIVLVGVALLAVIMVSRGVRSANRKD